MSTNSWPGRTSCAVKVWRAWTVCADVSSKPLTLTTKLVSLGEQSLRPHAERAGSSASIGWNSVQLSAKTGFSTSSSRSGSKPTNRLPSALVVARSIHSLAVASLMKVLRALAMRKISVGVAVVVGDRPDFWRR